MTRSLVARSRASGAVRVGDGSYGAWTPAGPHGSAHDVLQAVEADVRAYCREGNDA